MKLILLVMMGTNTVPITQNVAVKGLKNYLFQAFNPYVIVICRLRSLVFFILI